MISKIGSLIETIENDEKLIAYIKKAYKEKTGEEIVIPDLKHLSEIQSRKEETQDSHPNLKFNSFKDKVIAMNLPDLTDRETRMRLDKLRRMKDTKILIKESDLSHFEGKEMIPDLLYKVIDGFKALRSVEEINLSHNGLGDDCIDVICDFLMLKGLTKLNLSFNKLTKSSVKKLVATLKGCKRLLLLDVSYNEFNLDKYSCILVCGALKECDKIEHFGINDTSGDSSLRFINNHPTLISVNLEDSLYKKKNWDSLSKIISNTKKFKIENLSLKFCTIKLDSALSLIKAFKKNNTLKYLNLYNTGLNDLTGPQIIFAFAQNQSLQELDLGANKLSTNFCKAFGAVLRTNFHLRKVNITKNHMISRDDYFFILEGLVNNQSIISLGDLIDMKIGVKCRECTEKLLSMNKNIDWRDLEQIKKAKSNIYFSNIGTEHLQLQLEESKENNSSIDTNEKPVYNLKRNKTREDNIPYDLKVKKILKECPNKYFKETIEKVQYKKAKENEDINHIISPPKQPLDKKISNLSLNNYNKDGKYKVPYSIEKSNYIKELEKYQEENADGKNKKKKNAPKSAAKIKKGKGRQKPEPTLLNVIASITQEKIDNDEELKEFKHLNPEEKDTLKEMKYENTEEDITYGNVELNEMKFDSKDEQNIIEKYNLIENNFNNEFQEQTPFYY
jgi:hypothetical protein